MAASPVPDLTRISAHELLKAGRAEVIAENQACAWRWARMVEFHRRRAAAQPPRRPKHQRGRQAVLTARQETVVEIGDLWGLEAGTIRRQLNTALILTEHLPGVWALCQTGALSPARARQITEAVTDHLDPDQHPEELARFAEGITAFLHRHLTHPDHQDRGDGDGDGDGDDDGDDDGLGLVTCTRKQLANRISYQLRCLRPAGFEDRFRRLLRERGVWSRSDGDGMGTLGINGTTDRIQLAHHRLTLAAKQRRADGDDRTLDQLRADLALDLLTGVATNTTTTTTTREDHAQDGGPEVAVPGFARPIINLTVPIQTLMGLTDHPGVLSGGEVVPAGLARIIAHRPGATWYRMLTDTPGSGHGQGRMVELSTKSYTPTGPIWRHVVAEHGTCFRPGCDRPATECETDHRIPWPQGPTSTTNLWPGCPADHRAKHTPGFTIEPDPDTGGYVLKTRAGFTHHTRVAEHPAATEFPDLDPEHFQLSATELLTALAAVTALRERDTDRPINLTALWEDDPDLAQEEADHLDHQDTTHRDDSHGDTDDTAA